MHPGDQEGSIWNPCHETAQSQFPPLQNSSIVISFSSQENFLVVIESLVSGIIVFVFNCLCASDGSCRW